MTMCFISDWSLYEPLEWPFDNLGAGRDGNAKSISRAKRALRLCSEGNRPDNAVRHGFAPRFERERAQSHPIAASYHARRAWGSGRFRGNCRDNCFRIDQWPIFCVSMGPVVQLGATHREFAIKPLANEESPSPTQHSQVHAQRLAQQRQEPRQSRERDQDRSNDRIIING
jgi:hypothetical protein